MNHNDIKLSVLSCRDLIGVLYRIRAMLVPSPPVGRTGSEPSPADELPSYHTNHVQVIAVSTESFFSLEYAITLRPIGLDQ